MIERLSLTRTVPVLLQLLTMLGCPLPNESLGRSGCKVALSHIAVKIKYTPLSLIFSVEVWRRMIVIKHPYDDPEKHRDIWHEFFRLTPLVFRSDPGSRSLALSGSGVQTDFPPCTSFTQDFCRLLESFLLQGRYFTEDPPCRQDVLEFLL